MPEKIKFTEYMNKPMISSPIVLLENTRFFFSLEQSKIDSERLEFAKKLASFADIFVNDAFGTCHRKEASVYDIATVLPSCMGLLIEKEIEHLGMLLENPRHPYVAILGGAKVEDKINVIEALSDKVDIIIILGAMEFAFRKALGQKVGTSLCEGVEIARKVLSSSYASKIFLPIDTVIAKKDGENFVDIKTIIAGNIPDDYQGLDCGPRAVEIIMEKCSSAEMIFWNGRRFFRNSSSRTQDSTAL